MRKSITFKAKIVAYIDDKSLPVSVTRVLDLLEKGQLEFKSVDIFLDEPTLIFNQKDFSTQLK